MTKRASTGQNVWWSSYNYPTEISATDASGAEDVQFSYGPDRQRWKQIYTGPGPVETTYYVGGLVDVVYVSGTTNYRHYINAGGEPVAVYSRTGTGVSTMSYMLEDHEGSLSAIASNAGAADVNESFTAFGDRRNPVTWSGPPTTGDLNTIAGLSRQGYTFQTWLGQSLGLNHMNGRVEDATLGRFLSPERHITDPSDPQSYNRYSYVINDPLTYIDPTGFACTSSLAFHPGHDGVPGFPNDDGSFTDPIPVLGSTWTTTLKCDEPQDLGAPGDRGQAGEKHIPKNAIACVRYGIFCQPTPCRDSDHPLAFSIDVFADLQPLFPGIGGGLGLGITSNGQLFVEATAQAESGLLGNASVGLQASAGRMSGNLPYHQFDIDTFIGGQGAFGLGGVASFSVTHSSSGYNSFGKSVGTLGFGGAFQIAAVAGTTTRLALNSSACE
jgi:RHS repeat-associated protein